MTMLYTDIVVAVGVEVSKKLWVGSVFGKHNITHGPPARPFPLEQYQGWESQGRDCNHQILPLGTFTSNSSSLPILTTLTTLVTTTTFLHTYISFRSAVPTFVNCQSSLIVVYQLSSLCRMLVQCPTWIIKLHWTFPEASMLILNEHQLPRVQSECCFPVPLRKLR